MAVTVKEVTGQVAAAVADAVEQRGGQWAAPFTASGRRLPHNPVAGHAYTGVNWLLLSLAAASRGYGNGGWATSSQWQQTGCRVQRGERSIYAVRVDAPGGEDDAGLPSVRSYPLFHVSQVDGTPPPSDRFARPPGITHRAVTAAFRHTGARWIIQDGAAAHYDDAAGRIVTPPADMYLTPDLWASAVAHAHAHWAAAQPGGRRPAPGCEELTVELAAAAVCNSLGLEYTPCGGHADRLRECVPPLRSGHGAAALAVSAAALHSTAAYLVDSIEQSAVEQTLPTVSDGSPRRPSAAPADRPETDISLEEARYAVASWLLTEAARVEDLDHKEAADQVSTLLDCPAFLPDAPADRPSERVRRQVGMWLMSRAEEAGLATPEEAAAAYAPLLEVPEAALASPARQTDERSRYGLS